MKSVSKPSSGRKLGKGMMGEERRRWGGDAGGLGLAWVAAVKGIFVSCSDNDTGGNQGFWASGDVNSEMFSRYKHTACAWYRASPDIQFLPQQRREAGRERGREGGREAGKEGGREEGKEGGEEEGGGGERVAGQE